ncbi:hypothetical protein [Natrarchaeobius chitinivorans]|uniref:Uncharacterized protein n=1 Tax=Natrarchaeobius chitinivorans TaxID=1679083 RepID=A0A3N6N687_NATCH|nr:hypothetical protein [Natrarchaeobius chitinivorans]RQG93862.1 hypothetical protein EA473_14230 [Natrarchaeobius chitinivorans]
MTEQHSNADSTDRPHQATMWQGQEAMEQMLNVQRNMAEMTLSALKWQDTAQKQSMEMTRSMMGTVPGQQFTQSMLESYLQGMEAIVPEMKRAVEQGMQAADQPEQRMTGRSGQHAKTHQSTPDTQRREQRPHQRASGERETTRQRRRMDERRTPQQSGSEQTPARGETPIPQSGQRREGRRSSEPTQHPREPVEQQARAPTERPVGQSSEQPPRQSTERSPQRSGEQYPQTGEWVSQQEYAGDSSGERERRSAPRGQSGRAPQSGRQDRQPPEPRQRRTPEQDRRPVQNPPAPQRTERAEPSHDREESSAERSGQPERRSDEDDDHEQQ